MEKSPEAESAKKYQGARDMMSQVTPAPVLLKRLSREFLSEGVAVDEVDFEVDGEKRAIFHMATFDVAPNTRSNVDLHRVRETWFVLEGQADMLSGDLRQKICKGDVVYIESEVSHQLDNSSDNTLRILSLWW